MTKAGTKSLLSAVLVMLAVAGDRGQAEPYPSGPVKVISDSAPGSAPDAILRICLLYTSPSPRDGLLSRMPSSA